MDLDPKSVYNLLFQYAEDPLAGPNKCARLFTNLNDILTKKEVNLSYLDSHLQYMFNNSNGLLAFIETVLCRTKDYNSSIINILEILYTLISSFPSKLAKHVFKVHEICLKIIKSADASSKEKERALDVLNVSFEQIKNKSINETDQYKKMYVILRDGNFKKTDSVLGRTFLVLGTFGKKFQNLIDEPETLKSLFLSEIETYMSSKKSSYGVLADLFTGFNYFCKSFPLDLESEKDKIENLYKYIDTLSVPVSTTKTANRAALKFFANNISLFTHLIIGNFEVWHNTLLRWLVPDEQENFKVGVLVIRSFYQGLGSFLSEEETDTQYKNVVEYFVTHFRKTLNKHSTTTEKSLSLYGFFSFAEACQKFVEKEKINELLGFVIHSFEKEIILNQKEYRDDVLELLPNYIRALIKFVQYNTITNMEYFCLRSGVIIMIKTFPQLPYSHHNVAVDVLVFTFHYLANKNKKLFNMFVEDIVYQGVIWSCSHRHISGAEILKGNSDEVITVKNYFSLWKGLLTMSVKDKSGISDVEKYRLTKIVDELINTMFIMMDKLNISIVLTDVDYPVTDIECAYKVSHINDYAIFLNMVDFYQEIFVLIEPSTISKFICKLIHNLFSKCIKHPLISGFYKLLSCCLKICNELNFFNEVKIDSDEDVSSCYHLLQKFFHVLLNKTKELKGDLLIACFQVLLQYPTLIIRKMLPTCITPFRTMFEVGKNYIHLTDMALSTLEYWQRDIPNEDMEPFLVQVIPLLDYYLQSQSVGGSTQTDQLQRRRKTAQPLKKRQIMIEIQPELSKLQKKILNFIGKQSSVVCQAFVFSESNIELAIWGHQHHLKITLPYEDKKLDIYMDKCVIRIVHLSLNCTEKGTRLAACELLHATVMVFLGTTKKMNSLALADLNELLEHIAFPLLKLGCDMDPVVKQIFRPLFFQLVHWYTHPTQIGTKHTAVVIEAIMEGITHPSDTALRDFSGQCINEFVTWTIKQSDMTNLMSQRNIKVLIKKMRFYSIYPDSCKKLGAALIFNNIYKVIREENALLNIFWIELFHIFVKSSSMCEMRDKNSLTQINSALNHLRRGFVEKSELFNEPDTNRRIPIDIKGNTLKDVSSWLLLQTGSKSPFCREKCMELFCLITPYTIKYQNLQIFVSENVTKKEPDWISAIYESFLKKYPTLESATTGSDNDINPIKWVQGVICALSGYSFVIKNDLVPSDKWFLNDTVLDAIHYFINKISLITLSNALALVRTKEWTFTDFEKQEFDKEKAICVEKLYEFFNVILNNDKYSNYMNSFYGPELKSLVVNSVFNQQAQGFDVFIECDDNLTNQMKDFIKKLPEPELANILSDDIFSNNIFTDVFRSNIAQEHINMLKGLTMLQSFNINHIQIKKFTTGLVSTLLNKFICTDTLESGVIYENELPYTTLKYCLSILNFALEDEDEFKVFLEFLYKPYQVRTMDSEQRDHFGIYILSLFEDSLQKIIDKFNVFLDFILKQNFSLGLTIELILYMLNYLNNKHHPEKYKEVVENFLTQWNMFEEYFNQDVCKGISLVKKLLLVVETYIQDKNLNKWLINSLTRRQNLCLEKEWDIKMEIFTLIMGIVEATDNENINLIKTNLNYLKENFFLDSSPLPLESRVISLDKLLNFAPRIRTPALLLFLLDIYIHISTEESSSDVKSVLEKYMTRNTDTIQATTLTEIYKMCCDKELNFVKKYKLMSNITSLFLYCSINVFEEFFINNIRKITSALQEKTEENTVAEKILHFILLDVLCLRCPVSTQEAFRITQAALPNEQESKKLFFQWFEYTLNVFKGSDLISQTEELRLCRCYAYNAMISVVGNSIQEDKFYTDLFIQKDKNNVNILWSSLVDVHKRYSFETDFETIPKKKKILVNIRGEMTARKKLENKDVESVKYIESMRIFNSSLSEDITKFDFTNYNIRSQSEADQKNKTTFLIQNEVELECIDVNTHECMANVCGLIEHIVRAEITKLPIDENEEYILPVWVETIRTLLLNSNTHNNVKIFWVKVIDNTRHVFKHFAKWFLKPLLKFLVDRITGTSINYFTIDVVGILANWCSKVVPCEPEEVELASELLVFLINNVSNERRDMFKYHLELIRILVEAWKTSINIPHELIFSKLNDVDPTSGKVEIGIHLASIFLANNISPWGESGSRNGHDYFTVLQNIIEKNNKSIVYKACADTIGLILKCTNDQQLFNNVGEMLKNIDKHDKYARSLETMVLRYPQVADEFHLNKILNSIHIVPKDVKLIFLNIISLRYDVVGVVKDFNTKKWDSYIENDDLEVQLLTLEVVYKCIDVLKSSDNFNSIIQAVCKHISHPDVLCRTRMYAIVMQICQDKTLYSKEVVDYCEDVLIHGITDNNKEIREKVLEFWESDVSLPTPVSERFLYILTNLYRTETEGDFLGYSTYLLLDAIKKRDGYYEALFEYPLEDCDFEEYKLETNWRVRHLSVVPLFAETLQTLNENPYLVEETNFNKLRQTQTSVEFKPTMELIQSVMSQSSLHVKPENQISSIDLSRVTTSEENIIAKIRFQRDKSKISKYFAQQETKKSIERVEKRKDLVKERENKITLYRNYRKGDLPDIQIKLQDILQPLQVLTMHDDELAHILYIEIFSSIFSKMHEDQGYIKKFFIKIQEIFVNSTQYNRNVFRTLLNTLLLIKKCENMCQVISPDLVSTVSRSTGLATLGTLLLEEYLTNFYKGPTESKRSRNECSKSEENYCWVKLAELYKEMDEWDLVKSVFLGKINCEENIVHNATLAESKKQWQKAKELYEELIKTDEIYERKQNYYESYLKCFAHLGDWNSLLDSVHRFTSENDCWSKLWDQNFHQQNLLPWYIEGQLKKALFSGSISEQFLKDLNNTFDSNNLDYLQSNFTEELAMIWIFKEETDEAEQYVETYINNFLDNWQLLDPLYNNLRYKKILKLRNIVDSSKFIQVFNNLNIGGKIKLDDLINYWNRSIEETLPSILLCEERVLYRKQFINLLEKKINLEEHEHLKSFIEDLKQVKKHLDENLISAAIEEENLSMAEKYLGIYDSNVISELNIPFSKYEIIKSKTKESVEKLELLLDASDKLSSHLKVSAYLQRFSVLGEISDCCGDNSELLEMSKLRFNTVSSAQDISLLGVTELRSILLDYESEQRNRMEADTNCSNMNEDAIVANAYVQLAYFAKKHKYFTEFMAFVLKAMKFDSSEGRQLFPCILMEQNFSEDNKRFFVEETKKIPVWMFLAWIPQLLVNINSCKVSVVAPLILRIAETYPQSIMYAYRLSKSTFQINSYTEETQQLLKKLDNLLLNDNRIDKFLKALSFVGVPEAILMYYITRLIKACRSNEHEFDSIKNQIINNIFSDKPNSHDINAMQGDMFNKIKKFKNEISGITSCNGIETVLEEVRRQLMKTLDDRKEMRKNSHLLKDYSPWLASFPATAVNLDLEIPGQYDGKRIPLTQHHTRIVGFCPNVSCVFTSLRKPIKVTILGNDTKQYPFLIKFGEDVRQDQRIQQLFSLMNNIFQSDRNLTKEFSSIVTYQVVPLTPNLGMIQWLNNMIPLQEFIQKPLKSLQCFEEAFELYRTLINNESTNYCSRRDVYGMAAIKNSRDITIKVFRTLESKIQTDILRSAFLKISANIESFVALRNNFIRSYGVMCVSHWILGVGDRHLSNTLISQKNGKVLGVDFGHAFGTATQILSVPELVPFRLTPHIVNLMEPLKEKGLFRETMIRSLRALRQNTGPLFATMSVFIYEPTIDWHEHAYRFDENDYLNSDWNPCQKINQVRRKLNGANSTTIMCEDLRAGHQNHKNYLEAYLGLVKGDRHYNNFRAKKEEDNLSVEDQVDCLIDHATDYNLLGRMYEMWQPWV